MDTPKQEKPKNAQEPHEGFGDGDDDDPEDRLMLLQLRLSVSGAFLDTCASARAHGLEFDEIRQAFDVQLATIAVAEKSITAGSSPEEAARSIESAARRVAGLPDRDKKSS